MNHLPAAPFLDSVSVPLWELLQSLSAHPDLNAFRLVGGTALALQLGHRISVDIDWFCDESFDSEEVSELLVKKFGLRQASVVKNSISGEIDGIKIDVIAHRYPWFEDAVHLEGVRLASVSDIAAMKLNAIANRGSKKDFCDVAVLLNSYSLKQLMAVFEKRYPHVNTWQVVRSLTYFEDADSDPDPIALDDMTWSDVKSTILAAAKNIL
jgi:hypothetical protein